MTKTCSNCRNWGCSWSSTGKISLSRVRMFYFFIALYIFAIIIFIIMIFILYNSSHSSFTTGLRLNSSKGIIRKIVTHLAQMRSPAPPMSRVRDPGTNAVSINLRREIWRTDNAPQKVVLWVELLSIKCNDLERTVECIQWVFHYIPKSLSHLE